MRWINCKVYLFRSIGKLDLLINRIAWFCKCGALIAKMCLVFHFSFIHFLCNIILLQLPLLGGAYFSTLEWGLALWFAWPMECHGIPHFLLEINLTVWLKMGNNRDENSVALAKVMLKQPRAKHVRDPGLGQQSCQLNQLLL